MKRFTVAVLIAAILSMCLTSLAEAREPIYPRYGDRVFVENDTRHRMPLLRRIMLQVVLIQGPW